MRATSYGTGFGGKPYITIEGTEAEMDALKKMVAGLGYVACGREGMPLFAEKFEHVAPLPDPQLMQHFTPAPATVAKYKNGKLSGVKLEMPAHEESCCSIYVEHLCGYSYTPEGYARNAAKMQGMGFVCMRSTRDAEGKYWEAWYLPGIWAGEGAIAGCKTIESCINTLLKYVTPGSISAVRQRMALTID